MIAHNSRGTPDPGQQLTGQTTDAIRSALEIQRGSGTEPVPQLRAAIRAAAAEARDRQIHADSLLAQLNSLLSNAAADSTPHSSSENRGIKEWLVTACLKAYWYETL